MDHVTDYDDLIEIQEICLVCDGYYMSTNVDVHQLRLVVMDPHVPIRTKHPLFYVCIDVVIVNVEMDAKGI